jgi:hypothetical protein
MTKPKLVVALLLFVSHFGFSQTEKRIYGTVFCDNHPVEGVEVVNAVSKKTTLTDQNGHFSILVKAKDLLVFVSKIYEFKNIVLEQEAIDKNNFSIALFKKPEELKEVLITKTPSIHWKKDEKWEQEKRDQVVLEKARDRPKNPFIKDGTITNGMDFIKIGKMILHFLKKEKGPILNPVPEIEFKELATLSCAPDFFAKDLKLKPEEISLFLQFCDSDPKSKTILKNANVLTLMDFMFAKNVDFKKLAVSEK